MFSPPETTTSICLVISRRSMTVPSGSRCSNTVRYSIHFHSWFKRSLATLRSSRTRIPLPDPAAPRICRHQVPARQRPVPVQHYYRRRLGRRQPRPASRVADPTPRPVAPDSTPLAGALRRGAAHLAVGRLRHQRTVLRAKPRTGPRPLTYVPAV